MKSRIQGDWPRPHTYTGRREYAATRSFTGPGWDDNLAVSRFNALEFALWISRTRAVSRESMQTLKIDIAAWRKELRDALYKEAA